MGNIHCYSENKRRPSKDNNKDNDQEEKPIFSEEAMPNYKSHNLTIINVNQCFIKNHNKLFKSEYNSVILNYNDIVKSNLLGKGRFGSIYHGLSQTLGKLVTIKVLENLTQEKKNLIIQDLEFMYQLQHSNIVRALRVIDSLGKNDSELCLYYEYSNGMTIEDVIKQFGELNEKTIQIYVKQIIEGLAYLHSHGIVHKNLKASNILVEGNGIIKISDVLIDNILLGKNSEIMDIVRKYPQIQYSLPPFFLQKIDKDIDASYDFWCLGCIIIEMATGMKPWSHHRFQTQQEFFDFILNVQFNPPIPEHMSSACQSFIGLLFDDSQTSRSDIYKKLIEHDFLKSFASSVVVVTKAVNDSHSDQQQKCLGALLKSGNVMDAFKGTSSFVVSYSEGNSYSVSNNNSNIYVNKLSGKEQSMDNKKKYASLINRSVIKKEYGYCIQKLPDLSYNIKLSENDEE